MYIDILTYIFRHVRLKRGYIKLYEQQFHIELKIFQRVEGIPFNKDIMQFIFFYVLKLTQTSLHNTTNGMISKSFISKK